MDLPLVSVCLPNVNTFPFLEERLDTILSQSLTDWELIIIDSFSNDGSWELFEKLARSDRRVTIAQEPRGLYQSWNSCIQRAKGKYIYIATSDDTMAPDCLKKMVMALERNPECDIAQCRLEIIDKEGRTQADHQDCTVFSSSLKSVLSKAHVRRAPFDGLLHLTGLMVHLSITELLIRRSLFSKIGLFESKWGSIGDRNWEMKAGLVTNTVFLPDTWASWRMHSANASALLKVHSPEYCAKVDEMIEDALENCKDRLLPELMSGLKSEWLPRSRYMRNYYASLANLGTLQRRFFQISEAYSGDPMARTELRQRILGKPTWFDRFPLELKGWLESVGLGPMVVYSNGKE
jgi:glycosyltransferase involved in cell wall biosynthesis